MKTSPTIPPSKPSLSDTNAELEKLLAEVAGNSTSSAVAAGAAKMNAEQANGPASEEDWVLRPRTVTPTPSADFYWGSKGESPKPENVVKPDALSTYEGEYAKLIEDPAFESWLVTRGWAFGRNLITKDGQFNSSAGRTFWNWLGDVVSKNPDTQRSVTPEQYADGRYAGLGGDEAFTQAGGQAAGGTTAAPEERDPITTTQSVSRSTMNPAAAEAQVDNLARALLGRLATEKELTRYRKQINSFLAKNPTTSTSVADMTDPSNPKYSTTTKEGASASDAVNVLEMRLRRGSEGMAFNAGKMIEDALTGGSI